MVRYVGPRHIVIDDNPAPVPFWEPDRSFQGRTVVIVGGGPSHCDFPLSMLAGCRFVAVNSSCRRVRPIATADDPLYFSDNSWGENHPELLSDWPGPVVTANRNAKARLGAVVRRISTDELTMLFQVRSDYVQASSGHMAACLAAAMGARRVVLIGFECDRVDGRTHGHADYQLQDTGVFDDRFIPGWIGLAPAFRRLGVDLVNATPLSRIPAFAVPLVPLGGALS